jgi:Sex factor F TraW protein N terminal
MKKILLTTMAALALLASPATAVDLGAYGAFWDTEDADQALGAGAKVRFGIFELRGTYFSDVTADTEPESQDFEVSAIPLEAGLAFRFADTPRFSPYVGGGAGYYLLDTTAGDIDDEVGYYAVLGTDLSGPAGLGFMVEGLYRSMEATVRGDLDDVPGVDDDVDIQLGGFGINAGLIWRF